MVGNRTRVKVVKNKVRPAVQAGRVRHHVRQGHQPRGRPDRRRRRGGPRPQGRRLVHLRGRPARPGQGERPRPSSRTTPTWPTSWRRRSSRSSASARTVDEPAEPVRRAASVSMTSEPVARSTSAAGVDGLDGRRRGASLEPATGAADRPPADPRTADWARGRPRVGGPQDPARPADRAGPQPQASWPTSWPRKQRARRRSPTRLLDRFEEVGLVDDEAFARTVGRSRASRARAWPGGRWPRSCAARASTTRWPARRSTRSTRPTRRPRPARWSARSCASLRRLDDATADPAAGRDAGPQGLLLRAGLRRGPGRAAGAEPEAPDARTTARRRAWRATTVASRRSPCDLVVPSTAAAS